MNFIMYRLVMNPGIIGSPPTKNIGYVVVNRNNTRYYYWYESDKIILNGPLNEVNAYLLNKNYKSIKRFKSEESFKKWFTTKYFINLI
jgi:hypothetical protein